MLFLGIDPGKTGGWAVLDEYRRVHGSGPLPATPADVVALLCTISEDGTRRLAATMEYVRSSPQMGVVSAFSFGRGYGQLEGILAALSIGFDTVVPSVWQAALRCRSAGDKNVTKARAQELFPALTITHRIADALLIAEFGRRQFVAHHGEEREAGAADSGAPTTTGTARR